MLLKRILTVLIGAPFVVGAIVCPETAVFKGFVTVCIFFALNEFFAIARFSGRERFFSVALGTLYTLSLLFCPDASRNDLLDLTGLVLATFAFYCFLPVPNLEGIAQRIGLTLLGTLTVGGLGSLVGKSRDLPDGIFWVLVMLAMTWFNDTAAYFAGHRFGRRRLAPLISPGKTVEGFVGGFFGSAAGFLIFWSLLENPVSLPMGLLLVLAVGLAGPLGDLSESLIKRTFGAKDSGNLIPGHGGMLDRIDALLFTAPVVYFFARYFY